MKTTLLFFILNLICVIQVVSQINLIPNYSFENGSGVPGIERLDHPYYPGPCYCRYIHNFLCATGAANEFDKDIDNWENARFNNSLLRPTTPDWLDINLCPWDFDIENSVPLKYFLPYSGSRCLFLLKGSDADFNEGVRNSIPVLTTGIKYQLKIKVLFAIINKEGLEFSIYLTEKHKQWKTCPKKIEILKGEIDTSFIKGEWYEFSSIFTLSSNYNNLSNIVILAQRGNLYFDDVELYEFCPSSLLIENKTYTIKESAYEAGAIKAGYDIGSPTPNGEVIIGNNADIIYKAESEISLEPGFETQPGAEFLAYIASCGSNCPQLPTFDLPSDTLLCSKDSLSIGTNSLPNDISFHWTAEPPEALLFLDDIYNINPFFIPPLNNCGSITYSLIIRNECNEIATQSIHIKYNSAGLLSSMDIQNLTQNNTSMSFDAYVQDCTDKVLVQVFSSQNNYNNAIYSKTFTNGIDFQNNILHWSSVQTNTSPCFNYKIRITSYGICTDNEIEAEIIWNRNPQIQLLQLPNVITANNDNINDCLTFSVSGAEFYHVQVYKNWGNNLYDQINPITDQLFCTWKPSSSIAGGTYFWIARFWNNCGHEINTQGTVTVLTEQNKKELEFYKKTGYMQKDTLLAIHPNPFSNELTITFNHIGSASIILLDITGREVSHSNRIEEAEMLLPLQNIALGIYYLVVMFEDGFFETRKVIKE